MKSNKTSKNIVHAFGKYSFMNKHKRHVILFLICFVYLCLFCSFAYAISGPGYQNGEIITTLEVVYSWNLSSVYRRVFRIYGKIDDTTVFFLTEPDTQGSYSFVVPENLTGNLTIRTEGVNHAGTRIGGTVSFNVIDCPHNTITPQFENGVVNYLECSVCGKKYFDVVNYEGQKPTCTNIGWNAYCICSSCNYSSYVEIPALGHDLEHHSAKAETCTEVGWEEYDSCKRVDCNYTTYKEISALGHKLEYHKAQAPTCTTIGWNTYNSCSRCPYTTYKEIAALGHDWHTEYIWSTDNQTITANCTCMNNSSHVDMEIVNVTSHIQSPTNIKKGIATYKSERFTKEMFTEQSKVVQIPALMNMDVLRLPYMLNRIEDNAFENLVCSAIIVPNNCVSIGNHAFRNCKKLIYIKVPTNITIPTDAFEGCENLIIDRSFH